MSPLRGLRKYGIRMKHGALREGIGLGVNDMKWKELVHSCALAVHLVAGDAPGRGAFLRKVGAGTAPTDAALGTLGHPLPELEERVLRWLAEVPGK